jgi:hypothetical protein
MPANLAAFRSRDVGAREVVHQHTPVTPPDQTVTRSHLPRFVAQ